MVNKPDCVFALKWVRIRPNHSRSEHDVLVYERLCMQDDDSIASLVRLQVGLKPSVSHCSVAIFLSMSTRSYLIIAQPKCVRVVLQFILAVVTITMLSMYAVSTNNVSVSCKHTSDYSFNRFPV